MIPYDSFELFKNAESIPEPHAKKAAVKGLIDILPPNNRGTLEYIVSHLKLVTTFAEDNLMDVNNIAIVFAPCLFRNDITRLSAMEIAATQLVNVAFQNNLVSAMITHHDYFFEK